MNKIKNLSVSTPQGHSGQLRKESRFSFGYETGDKSCEISLTMPIRHETYASTELLPIFAMNKPEGYLLERISKRFAKVGGLDDMALLKFTGHSQIGRLTITDPQEKTQKQHAKVSLSEVLKSPSQELFDWLAETYLESGISGFQPKVLANAGLRTSSPSYRSTGHTADLIVKSSGQDYPHIAQNEFLCMDAARRAGIMCPKFWLSEDGELFVMDRFDLTDDGSRLGFEDACVLMGRMPAKKYESSYEMLARVVQDYCAPETQEEGLQRLFEYITLSVMTRNGDAHLKNFGLLYEHPVGASPRLAPLYDVVTTSIYAMGEHPVTGGTKYDRTLALKLAKSSEYPDRETLEEFGREHCRVRHPRQVFERIAAGMEESLKENEARINGKLFALMRKEWDSGIWHALNNPGRPRPPKPAGPK